MEKKILSKEEFLKGLGETARVHYPKFYEKFVLSFDNDDSMVASICLLIDVDKYYNEYKNAKKHFTQLFGYEDSEFELLYQINMIKELATNLNMYKTLSSNKDFITWE